MSCSTVHTLAELDTMLTENAQRHRKFSHFSTSSLQFGFKAGCSTTLCTGVVKNVVSHYIHRRSAVMWCFLDASKAIDLVNQHIRTMVNVTWNHMRGVLCTDKKLKNLAHTGSKSNNTIILTAWWILITLWYGYESTITKTLGHMSVPHNWSEKTSKRLSNSRRSKLKCSKYTPMTITLLRFELRESLKHFISREKNIIQMTSFNWGLRSKDILSWKKSGCLTISSICTITWGDMATPCQHTNAYMYTHIHSLSLFFLKHFNCSLLSIKQYIPLSTSKVTTTFTCRMSKLYTL